MAWGLFRRKKPSRYMVFASTEALDAWKRRLAEADLTYVGTHEHGGATYDVLRGDDPERAKVFLRAEKITRERYYLVVETPDGTWGTDIETLYLENLRPWQRDTANPDCDGTIESLIDGWTNLMSAAQGIQDNFLVEARCGRCGHEWIDAVQYQRVTVVRCPSCRAINRLDPTGITVSDYGG